MSALDVEAASLYREGASPATPAAMAPAVVTAVAEGAPFVLLLVLADRMTLAFGVGDGAVTLVRVLCLTGAAVGAIGGAVIAHGRAVRGRLVAGATCGAAAAIAAGSICRQLPLVTAALVAASLAFGAARTARHGLLVDVGTRAQREGMLLLDRTVMYLGTGAVALVALWAPDGWRGAALVVAALALAAGAAAGRAQDPGYGTADAAAVRQLANTRAQATADVAESMDVSVGEALRQLLAMPVTRLGVVGVLTLGATAGPVWVFATALLREREHVAADGRAAVVAIAALLAVGFGAAAVLRSRGKVPALLLGGVVAVIGVVVVPGRPAAVLGLGVFFGALAITEAALVATVSAGVPAALRPHATGLLGAAWFAGAAQALLFAGSLERRYGPGTAVVVVAVGLAPVAAAVAAAVRASAAQGPALAASLVEDQEVRLLKATGSDVPLLACSHVDFRYGTLQVLFDVSFSVAPGEMVALLGTNGAGKSTLLRVISGLGRPAAGTIRFDGRDVTNADAPRRVAAGIVQVPGGKATFPTLSVAENLRANGYLLGRRRRVVESRIDEVFVSFPALAERRHQPALTLSGGEAQMLALGKALLLRPRLLLIDELSLGLAPKVVGELLDMVSRINDGGTAVVLVEQSVNIALSLVDHAYFMEKGRIRFDGAAAELLGRDDLLRSVFLEGAGSVG